MKTAIPAAPGLRLLPEGRMAGPMPWVIAVMMFLSVLAAAASIGLGSLAAALDGGNRLTIQIIQADPARREAEAAAAVSALRSQQGLRSVRRVRQEELQALLEPWLGEAAAGGDIPIPAVVEAELTPGGSTAAAEVRTLLRGAAPSTRVDDNAEWLAPLGKLIGSLRWLAAALVLLTGAATAAVVVLATRAALDTHRETIEVLHLMGATDTQVTGLFQRRIGTDALWGGLAGLIAAAIVLWLIRERTAALGSELVGSVALPDAGWVALGLLPLAGVAVAMLVARMTILKALVRLL